MNNEDVPARVDRVRGSLGNEAMSSGTTFEKAKMLQITTNLNEIFITNCQSQAQKNSAGEKGGFFQFLQKDSRFYRPRRNAEAEALKEQRK